LGDCAIAKTACEAVINSGRYSIVEADDFAGTYRMDNPNNFIFELAFSSVDNANINGLAQIYRGASYGDISGLTNLEALFEAGDVRNAPEMIGPDPDKVGRPITNLGKFPSTDYSDEVPVIRYEEVILNYAEALYRANNADPNALTRINSIVEQRGTGLTLYASVTEDNLLNERRKELCFEGLRFMDIIRTGRDIPNPDIEQTHGGPDYGTYKLAFPIPDAEMQANSNMVQNNGYENK